MNENCNKYVLKIIYFLITHKFLWLNDLAGRDRSREIEHSVEASRVVVQCENCSRLKNDLISTNITSISGLHSQLIVETVPTSCLFCRAKLHRKVFHSEGISISPDKVYRLQLGLLFADVSIQTISIKHERVDRSIEHHCLYK